MKIAVIDDDPLFQTIVSTQLKRLDEVQILTFANGQDAWQFLSVQHQQQVPLPDIILIDLNMPIMDGWELLRAINSLTWSPDQTLPCFYIVTSSIDRHDQALVADYPFVTQFISKPLSRDVLQAMIARRQAKNQPEAH